MRIHAGTLLLLLLALASRPGVAASDYSGQVSLAGVPIPGAAVTATSASGKQTTITDQDGVYRFAGLADGVWTIRVEMIGFETLTFEVTIPPPAEGPAPVSELTLLPLEKIVSHIPAPKSVTPEAAPPADGRPVSACRRQSGGTGAWGSRELSGGRARRSDP